MKRPIHKTLLLLILFIFTYGIGLFPLIFFLKFLFTLNLNNLIHLLSLPFLLILGFIIFVLGEVFSTGLIARIFRYKEGNFKLDMDDSGLFKWLAYQTIYYPLGYFLYSLTVEPLKALHLRLCGAKIGKYVNMGGFIADPCLFEVEDNTTIGGFCEILSHSAERGRLIVKKVKIGKNCLVGEFSLILPGVRMEDGSILCANSLANKNKVLREGKVYVGTPARLIKKMILPEKRKQLDAK